MKLTSWIIGSTLGVCSFGCSASTSQVGDDAAPRVAATDDDDDDDQEEQVALADVPAAIKDAALAAVPGLVLDSAEKEVENGVTLYSLEGTAGGQDYCVEVSLDGKVLEVENESADNDDDDGDDDED